MLEAKTDLTKLPALILNIYRAGARAVDAFEAACQDGVENVYMKRLKAAMSLDDHTLQILGTKALGPHPYAKKWGSILSNELGHPGYEVHMHNEGPATTRQFAFGKGTSGHSASGKRVGGLFPTIKLKKLHNLEDVKQKLLNQAKSVGAVTNVLRFEKGALGDLQLGWDVTSDDEITHWVVEGTPVMIERPVGKEIADQTRSELQDYVRGRFRIR